jgi:type I restriction enzyme S subunit
MEHDLDPVYLGMFFKSNSFYSQKLPYVNGSKVKRISTSNLQKIVIPVPERGVQKMLGENLLALENLVKSASVGLPAEIAARRQQYEYYRDKLLTFKELDVA